MSVQTSSTDDWARPRPTRSDYRYDIVLAIVLGIGATLSALLYGAAGFYEEPAETWVTVLLIIAGAAPIAVRRRFPLTVAIIAAAAFAATQILLVPELLITQIELFVAIYTAGAWSNARLRSQVVRIGIIVGMFIWIFVNFATMGSNSNSYLATVEQTSFVSPVVAFGLINVLTNVLYFGGAYYFGERAWTAARQRAELRASTLELAAERERSSAQAVTLERLRIARELHDVVAHHVSVMGVQAGAARRLLDKDPERAATSLSAIESSARDAVDELHQMLATLRDDDTEPAISSPSTRGIDQLPALIEEASAAGLPVTFTVIGDDYTVQPTVGLTVYRIAQEAITNTMKHAGPGATADVRLRYLTGAVEVEISDTGLGLRGSPGGGTRLGQRGMHERVNAVGGSVSFGPRERGGYLVRATIPTAIAPASTSPTVLA